MRCAIYARVSSEQQRENTSIDQQLVDCRAFAKRSTWSIQNEYVDIAESGRKTSRPELQRLLADVAAQRVDVVLVWKIDRLARNTRLALELIESHFHAIQFVSVTEAIDRTSAGGKFGLTMQLSAAQFYSDVLSERTARALTYRAQHGKWVGLAPFGYTVVDGILQPTDDATTVQLIFSSYAAGDTFSGIADHLNGLGYHMYNCRTKQHNSFGRENIRAIIRNRAYIGKVSSGGIEYDGLHTPLISNEIWYECAEVRRQRSQNQRRPVRGENPSLLSGIVHCAICGSRMWCHGSRDRHNETRYYYRCSKSASWATCDAPMSRALEIDNRIVEYLMSIELSPAIITNVVRKLERHQQPQKLNAAKINDSIQRYAEIYADGLISRETYLKKRKELEAQLIEKPTPRLSPARIRAMLADFPLLLRSATVDEKRQLVHVFFAHVWINDNALSAVTPNAIYMELVQTLRASATTFDCSVSGVEDGAYPRSTHYTIVPLWSSFRGLVTS